MFDTEEEDTKAYVKNAKVEKGHKAQKTNLTEDEIYERYLNDESEKETYEREQILAGIDFESTPLDVNTSEPNDVDGGGDSHPNYGVSPEDYVTTMNLVNSRSTGNFNLRTNSNDSVRSRGYNNAVNYNKNKNGDAINHDYIHNNIDQDNSYYVNNNNNSNHFQPNIRNLCDNTPVSNTTNDIKIENPIDLFHTPSTPQILWERLCLVSQRLLLAKAAQARMTNLHNVFPDEEKDKILKGLSNEVVMLSMSQSYLQEALQRVDAESSLRYYNGSGSGNTDVNRGGYNDRNDPIVNKIEEMTSSSRLNSFPTHSHQQLYSTLQQQHQHQHQPPLVNATNQRRNDFPSFQQPSSLHMHPNFKPHGNTNHNNPTTNPTTTSSMNYSGNPYPSVYGNNNQMNYHVLAAYQAQLSNNSLLTQIINNNKNAFDNNHYNLNNTIKDDSNNILNNFNNNNNSNNSNIMFNNKDSNGVNIAKKSDSNAQPAGTNNKQSSPLSSTTATTSNSNFLAIKEEKMIDVDGPKTRSRSSIKAAAGTKTSDTTKGTATTSATPAVLVADTSTTKATATAHIAVSSTAAASHSTIPQGDVQNNNHNTFNPSMNKIGSNDSDLNNRMRITGTYNQSQDTDHNDTPSSSKFDSFANLIRPYTSSTTKPTHGGGSTTAKHLLSSSLSAGAIKSSTSNHRSTSKNPFLLSKSNVIGIPAIYPPLIDSSALHPNLFPDPNRIPSLSTSSRKPNLSAASTVPKLNIAMANNHSLSTNSNSMSRPILSPSSNAVSKSNLNVASRPNINTAGAARATNPLSSSAAAAASAHAGSRSASLIPSSSNNSSNNTAALYPPLLSNSSIYHPVNPMMSYNPSLLPSFNSSMMSSFNPNMMPQQYDANYMTNGPLMSPFGPSYLNGATGLNPILSSFNPSLMGSYNPALMSSFNQPLLSSSSSASSSNDNQQSANASSSSSSSTAQSATITTAATNLANMKHISSNQPPPLSGAPLLSNASSLNSNVCLAPMQSQTNMASLYAPTSTSEYMFSYPNNPSSFVPPSNSYPYGTMMSTGLMNNPPNITKRRAAHTRVPSSSTKRRAILSSDNVVNNNNNNSDENQIDLSDYVVKVGSCDDVDAAEREDVAADDNNYDDDDDDDTGKNNDSGKGNQKPTSKKAPKTVTANAVTSSVKESAKPNASKESSKSVRFA